MAFTSGFFNSFKGDRKYNAEQLSEIFDGVLTDGIIPSQGQLFDVNTAENGMQITIGTGRAWFDHTWSKNDSIMVLTVEPSDITRPRYDTVVLEVNHEDDVRSNSITIVKGVAAINADKPILLFTDKVKQYPLAHILVRAGTDEIRASDIENMVGREPTVFATGILETVPIDDLWSKWEGEWRDWFNNIKLQLSTDIVSNLQYQIDQLKERMSIMESKVKIVTKTYTDIITNSQTWRNPSTSDITAMVRVFGGGAGGCSRDYYKRGGGGGHMASGSFKISGSESVNITIGNGSDYQTTIPTNTPTAAGTTSFGTYISANGASGINGGTGGGGAGYFPDGGTGSYGGGGGAGGAAQYQAASGGVISSMNGGNGGSGGEYGGGGGGGGGGGTYCAQSYSSFNGPGSSGGTGGSKGSYGGAGGAGGAGGSTKYGTNTVSNATGKAGSKGSAGTNTNNITGVEFKGTGSAGGAGGAGTLTDSNVNRSSGGGGGGGGGGYGGQGGSGGTGCPTISTTNMGALGGGGGGGGGYGAAGGAGSSGVGSTVSSTYAYYEGAGGGGGGYGGIGKEAISTSNGSIGGGGGGYGTSNYACGGNGGKNNGSNGVCIISYTITELVVG